MIYIIIAILVICNFITSTMVINKYEELKSELKIYKKLSFGLTAKLNKISEKLPIDELIKMVEEKEKKDDLFKCKKVVNEFYNKLGSK